MYSYENLFFSDISRICLGYVLDISGTYLDIMEHIWNISKTFLGNFGNISGTYPGPVCDISWTSQPSATCSLNIALATCDGCDKF